MTTEVYVRDVKGRFAEKTYADPGQIQLDDGSNYFVDTLPDDELLEAASKYGARLAARFGGDRDDYAQQLALQVLARREKFLGDVFAAPDASLVERPYLKAAAASLARELASNGVHPNIRKAWAQMRAAEEQYRETHGTVMPPSVREQVAQQITLSAPKGRRPTKGWHKMPAAGMTVPLMVADEQGRERVNPQVDPSRVTVTLTGSHTEDDGGVFDGVGREQLWQALASQRDVGQVGVLSRDQAGRAQVTLAAHGGTAAVASRWLQGELADEHPAVKSLLAPFAGTYQQHNNVAVLLREHPEYAEHIWRHCARAATTQKN